MLAAVKEKPPLSAPARLAQGIARELARRPAGENSRHWLALRSGVVSSSYLSRLEKGDIGDVGLSKVIGIARALGVSVSRLIDDENR